MITNTEGMEDVKETVENRKKIERTPTECLMKKPLNYIWSLWYLENDRNRSWEENLSEITNFNTLEEFWSFYNLIKLPSQLSPGSDYSFFKYGISPLWEDESNKLGGRWVISLSKKQRISDLDRLWLNVILELIGEAFGHSEQICGAVVKVRPKGDKITIWTADGTNEIVILEIGHKLKEILHFTHFSPKFNNLHYRLHKDGEDAKSLFFV